LVNGRAEIDENSSTIIVDRVTDLNEALQRRAKEMVIRLPEGDFDAGALCDRVVTVLEKSKGECEVLIELPIGESLICMRAHHSLKVQGSSELEGSLRELGCNVRWEGHAVATSAAAAGSKS
jgi:hypothetical protein